MKITAYSFFISVLFICYPIVNSAQWRTADLLTINPTGESAARGSANVASTQGADALLTNIAGIASVEGASVQIDRGYLGFGSTKYLGVKAIQRVSNKGVLGVGMQALEMPTIALMGVGTGPNQMEMARFIIASGSMGYSQQIGKRLYIGGLAQLNYSRLGNVSAENVQTAFGIQYSFGKKNQFHIGSSLRGPGSDWYYRSNDEPLFSGVPSNDLNQRFVQLDLAGTYYLTIRKKNKFNFDMSYAILNFTNNQWRFGVNYNRDFSWLSYRLSAGYVYVKQDEYLQASGYSPIGYYTPPNGFSAGVGLYKNIRGFKVGLEYSSSPTQNFFNVHAVSLKFDFL